MRKFVLSVIMGMLVALLSIIVLYVLQAPLFTLMYYGFFSEGTQALIASHIVNARRACTPFVAGVLGAQAALSCAFAVCAVVLVGRVLRIFLPGEGSVRGLYILFFSFVLVVPVVTVYVSVPCRAPLSIAATVLAGIAVALCVCTTVLLRRILPDTGMVQEMEERRYLYSEEPDRARGV